jgi:hypothetical protein
MTVRAPEDVLRHAVDRLFVVIVEHHQENHLLVEIIDHLQDADRQVEVVRQEEAEVVLPAARHVAEVVLVNLINKLKKLLHFQF